VHTDYPIVAIYQYPLSVAPSGPHAQPHLSLCMFVNDSNSLYCAQRIYFSSEGSRKRGDQRDELILMRSLVHIGHELIVAIAMVFGIELQKRTLVLILLLIARL
jgi:hypothetical protein